MNRQEIFASILIRKFIRIPIDDGNKDTFGVYLDYYGILVNGSYPDINRTMAEYSSDMVDEDDKNALLMLETASAVYDFLYSFTRIFGSQDDLGKILDGKLLISEKIFKILDRQELNLRACPYCGKKLKWSYKFNMCQECFRKRRHLRKQR